MVGKDMMTMSQRDLNRLHIAHKILDKELKQVDAAGILKLSARQIRRIIKKVRTEGDRGILHKARGRGSNRKLSKKIKKKTIKLYKQKYSDFGPTLANEKLFEIDKIKIANQTLRNWLIEKGEWVPKRRKKKYRQWRERKPHFGQMLQGDGSEHDWFEDRAPKCVLMGYIDDATGNVFARFYKYEGTIPAMDSFKRYIKKYGIPQSIYMDNHAAYKNKKKLTIEEELEGRKPLSQFERGVKELGVEFIHAHSPEAKGRIERLFETFQDRVIKEMRLAGVNSIPEGNKFLESYLPKYNKRFRVLPAKKGNVHRTLEKHIKLDAKLCIKNKAVLRNDFTAVCNKKLYQILDKTRAKKITIEERLNGRIVLTDGEKILKYKEILQRPAKSLPKKKKLVKQAPNRPANNHPWKKWIEGGYPQNPSYSQRKKKEAKKKEKLLLLVH